MQMVVRRREVVGSLSQLSDARKEGLGEWDNDAGEQQNKVHIGEKGTQEVSIGYRVVEQGEEGKSEGV